MSKINVMGLAPLETLTETRSFTDPKQPGNEITLTFASKPDFSNILRVRAMGDDYAVKRGGNNAVPITMGGDAIRPTPELCRVIALVQTVEQGEPSDKYTFEEWVLISSRMPSAFMGIVQWANEITARAYEDNGTVEVPND